MNKVINGWFSEVCDMWPGQALSLDIKQKLYTRESKFQKIDIYETKGCGKMLVLDGIIQFTESDEFAYQEMLTHVAMFSHPNPKRVLVIGGGDGGILREVCRHSMVNEVDICEIDEDVISLCREFIPSMGCGFNDKRVNIHICDGTLFIKKRQCYYDIIIIDSTDPIGIAKHLFEKPFYASIKNALNLGGIVASQAESFFLHKEIVQRLLTVVNSLFPVWGYAYLLSPTYPGGNIGVCLASLGRKVKKAVRKPCETLQSELKYYTSDIHEAAFVLPAFGREMVMTIKQNLALN